MPVTERNSLIHLIKGREEMKQVIAGYEHISSHKPFDSLDWKTGPNALIRLVWNLGIQISYSYRLARQRQQLAELSDEMLKDVGISRTEAVREASRHFWDEPSN